MSTVNELLNYFVVNDDNDDLNKNDEKNKNKEKTVVRRYFPGKVIIYDHTYCISFY